MIKNSLYFCAVGLIVVASVHAPKERYYYVSHEKAEWAQILFGLKETQRIVHKSVHSAHDAFYVDSTLSSLRNDITVQLAEHIPSEIPSDGTKTGDVNASSKP